MRTKGMYGDDKVFIHAAWAASGTKDSLPEFKRKLVEAHRKGEVRLARADLVEAMDPYDVKRSDTHLNNSTFNFIDLLHKPRR